MGATPNLVITSPDGHEQSVRVALRGTAPFIIGSNPGADLHLDNPTIGKPQCQLRRIANDIVLENLDDEWGTVWNEDLIREPVPIKSGDRIEIGDLVVTVELTADANPGSPQDSPAPASTTSQSATGAARATQSRAPAPPPPSRRTNGPTSKPATRGPRPYRDPSPSGRTDPPTRSRASSAQSPRPERPASPPPSPPSPPVDKTPPSSSRTGDELTQLILHHLESTCEAQVSACAPAVLNDLISRSIPRAAAYGLTSDQHVAEFVECVVLVGDDLDGPDCSQPDIWFALTIESQPPDKRIGRAVKLARKAAGRTLPSSPSPAASPAPAPPSVPAVPPPDTSPERISGQAIETPEDLSTPASPTGVPDAAPLARLSISPGIKIDSSAHVASSAMIVGDVVIGAGCRVMHGAMLIAETGTIHLGSNSVVMEQAVIRSTVRHPVRIDHNSCIGPNTTLYGCSIGHSVYIAPGARVLHGALVDDRAIVRANAVVQINTTVPKDTTVPVLGVAVGLPVQILTPDQSDAISTLLDQAGFHQTVLDGSPSTHEQAMAEFTRQLASEATGE